MLSYWCQPYRTVDKNDRDSLIFADGAGAAIVEKSEDEGGILSQDNNKSWKRSLIPVRKNSYSPKIQSKQSS